MNEEIVRILEMVKKGKITAEEGEKLISAVTGVSDGSTPAPRISGKKFEMLRVRVNSRSEKKEDNARVEVNVPLSIAKKALGLVSLVPNEAKKELAAQGIDLDAINLTELIEMFESGDITEELVNVESGDEVNGATVKVYVD